MVPEAQDAVAVGFDETGARGVRLDVVLAAVEFDREVEVARGEVGDVGADDELAGEFDVVELSRAEVGPEAGFGVRGVAAEFSGERR